jgi:hypothetical protein
MKSKLGIPLIIEIDDINHNSLNCIEHYYNSNINILFYNRIINELEFGIVLHKKDNL